MGLVAVVAVVRELDEDVRKVLPGVDLELEGVFCLLVVVCETELRLEEPPSAVEAVEIAEFPDGLAENVLEVLRVLLDDLVELTDTCVAARKVVERTGVDDFDVDLTETCEVLNVKEAGPLDDEVDRVDDDESSTTTHLQPRITCNTVMPATGGAEVPLTDILASAMADCDALYRPIILTSAA